MISWRFYIRDNDTAGDWQEIDEPIGWDGDELILSRSPNYEGLENYKSTEMEFYDDEFTGRTTLIAGYELRGYDANFDIKIDAYCKGLLTDSIVGYLNFLTYIRQNNTVKIQFEESSFSRTFKSRMDTIVNLDSAKGIDGGDLTPLTRKSVKLHSKEIQLLVTSEFSAEYDETNFAYESSGVLPSPPYQFQGQDIHHVSSGGSGFENKSTTFYFQISPDDLKVTDTGLVEYNNIPTGISTLENPLGTVKTAGKITVDLNLNAAFFVWTLTDIMGGASAKLHDCGDAFANSNFLVEHFDFQIEVKIGSESQANGISSYDRSICSEEFFGDLVGKNEDYFSAGGSMLDTFTRPFTTGAQARWIKKNRFQSLAYSFDFDNALVGDDIYIRLVCNVSGDFEKRLSESIFAYTAEGYLAQGSSISINSSTVTDPTDCKGYLVYEAFNRIAESITGRTDAIRSDYFGRTDSVPKTYDENGCESLMFYTNGKNIRNLKDLNGDSYPIFMSFTDLYLDVTQKRCIGFRIERTGGIDYIRIEPIEYFYTRDSQMTFIDVSNIREEVAVQRLYNDFEIGYNQWEIENLNGVDEFNTKRTYSIPSRNIKNKLQAVTNYLAGGYAIEMTRRMQGSDNPTTDWKYDDQNFCISLNRIVVVTDAYSDTVQSYEIGTVSERSELYNLVENVISPLTAYNLRFSPAESALFWLKKLSPALLLKDDQRLVFQSGTGNLIAKKTKSDVDQCSIVFSSLSEKQDITATDTTYDRLESIALYYPIWISFSYPLSYSEFILIRENSNKSFTVTCSGRTYEGFIEEVKYKPNTEGGKADFKLLVTVCEDKGEFNDDFSDDFNTGTC